MEQTDSDGHNRHLESEFQENSVRKNRSSRFDRFRDSVSSDHSRSVSPVRDREHSQYSSKSRSRYRDELSSHRDDRRSRSHSRDDSRSRHRSKSSHSRRHGSKTRHGSSKSKSKRSKTNREKRSRSRSRHRHNKSKKTRHDISDTDSEIHRERETLNRLKARIAALERYRRASPCFSFDADIQEDSDAHTYDGNDRCSSPSSMTSDRPESAIATQCGSDALSVLAEGAEGSVKGPPLGEEPMILVKSFFEKEPETGMFKTIIERYPEPDNAAILSSKNLNSEIYRNINKFTKTRDLKARSIQSGITTACIANLRLVDELTKLHKLGKLKDDKFKSLLQLASDSTKLMAKSSSDLSLFRKSLLRPHVQPKYQMLCGTRTAGPTLFGSDLAKEVKAIDDESKIMRQLNKPQNAYHQRFDRSGSKNWQARGRGYFRPQYGQNRGKQRQFRGRNKVHTSTSQPPNNQSAQQ